MICMDTGVSEHGGRTAILAIDKFSQQSWGTLVLDPLVV